MQESKESNVSHNGFKSQVSSHTVCWKCHTVSQDRHMYVVGWCQKFVSSRCFLFAVPIASVCGSQHAGTHQYSRTPSLGVHTEICQSTGVVPPICQWVDLCNILAVTVVCAARYPDNCHSPYARISHRPHPTPTKLEGLDNEAVG